MRYKITLSYSGRDFHGWQVQPSEPSVQQTLTEALSTLLRAPVTITGAGRTDTGVNALRYVAHFDAAEGLDTNKLQCKLNAITPQSIAVHLIEPTGADFHARFDAVQREYTYFLHRVKDPFADSYSYQCSYPCLDFGLMNEAAQMLAGRHDFRCFEKSGTDTATSICTISSARWQSYDPLLPVFRRTGPDGTPAADYWFFRIRGDRFLRNMVRALVGTMIEVGRGKRNLAEFSSLILEPGAIGGKSVMRSLAGESAPGHALFLTGVEYGRELNQEG